MESQQKPQSREAERHLLWAIMTDHAVFGEVSQIVRKDDFASFAHQAIFEACQRLIIAGRSTEPQFVFEELAVMGLLADVGGPAYIADIFTECWTAKSPAGYAEIVASKAQLRRVIESCERLIQEAAEPGASGKDVLSKAEQSIFDLAREDGRNKTVAWSACVAEANDVIDRRAGMAESGETEEGLRTGWPTLDKLTGGLHKRELVILAARPGGGKTLAALNIIDNVAAEGASVYFASLEQGRVELVHRILSRRSGVNSHKFRTGAFTPYDVERLVDSSRSIRGHKIWINDASSQSLVAVVSESRRLKMRHGLDLIVVDYLGLMDTHAERRSSTRTEEIGRLTRGLKRLAKDLDVTVICLAQLNRGSENRNDRKPRLSDLRDSGEIEQDADTVFLLHKPDDKDFTRDVDQLDWLVEKQRNGPCGEIKMEHWKRTFEIREATT